MSLEDFLREWRLDNPEGTICNNGEEFPWNEGKYLKVTCPFCKLDKQLGPDKSHHCHVHTNWFCCQRCGTKGGINYLMGRDIQKKPPTDWNTFQVPIPTIPKKEKKLVNLFNGSAANSSPGATIWLGDLPTTHIAWQYLLSEKFTRKEIEQLLQHYPIHFCTEGKSYTKKEGNTTTGRIIFTILEKGMQIGWQARWLPKSWPPSQEDIALSKSKEVDRYITSPGFKKSFTLYNIENALKWDTIVVVEGVKKVWKTGTFSVATFGIGSDVKAPEGLSNHDTELFWLNRLASACQSKRKVWFLYDGNAMSKALAHAEAIQNLGGNVSIIPLEQGKPEDVDNYCKAEIIQLLLKRKGKLPKLLPPLNISTS